MYTLDIITSSQAGASLRGALAVRLVGEAGPGQLHRLANPAGTAFLEVRSTPDLPSWWAPARGTFWNDGRLHLLANPAPESIASLAQHT